MNTSTKIPFWVCIIYLQYVFCENCNVRVDHRNKPIVLRKIGKKAFVDNASFYNGVNNVNIKPKETIELFCESGFVAHFNLAGDPNGLNEENTSNSVKSLSLECAKYSGSNAYFLKFTNSVNEQWFDPNAVFECSFNNLQIYESNTSLANCEDYSSYGLSTGLNTPIGICFDLNTFHIKYAKYIADRPFYNYLYQKAAMNETIVDLDVELNNFDFLLENSFMATETFNNLYNAKKSEIPLLEPFVFEYNNIVQDDNLNAHFTKFDALFKVVWWRELREGNWLNFQNALNERIQNVTYMVHTGVSGSLTIPTAQNPRVFQVRQDDKFVKAPAYIWSYLKSLEENTAEEFVIIAHNTPFYKTGEPSIFCEDMCNEVNWLQNSLFQKLHLMPVFGVVNCCRPVDVADKLDNFPVEHEKLPKRFTQVSTERSDTE